MDEMRMVRELYGETPPDPHLEKKILAQLTEPPRRRLLRVPRPALRPAWTAAGLGLAAAGMAAAVAIAAAGSGPASDPEPRTADMSARSILLAAAEKAERAPDPGTGKYWYSQIRSIDRARKPGERLPQNIRNVRGGYPHKGELFAFSAYVTSTWETWDPRAQGTGTRQVHKDFAVKFSSAADKAAWRKAGSPKLHHWEPSTSDDKFDEPFLELGPKGIKMADLHKLPTDAARLEALVRDDWEQARSAIPRQTGIYAEWVWDAAGSILGAPVTPGTRAAAFRMLADQEGVRAIGKVTDQLGRPGIALAIRVRPVSPEPAQRKPVEMRRIIDPSSSKWLASQKHRIGSDGKPEATPIESTLTVTEGWTDEIGVPAKN